MKGHKGPMPKLSSRSPKQWLGQFASALLSRLGIAIVSDIYKQAARNKQISNEDLRLLLALEEETKSRMTPHLLSLSRSQMKQDLFVLATLDFLRQGYFVEFGATDGLQISNTHILEKEFGWSGILAEPGTSWQESLSKNRTASIDNRLVWKSSGDKILFRETEDANLSTVAEFSDADSHRESRFFGQNRLVETVSLTDLLKEHKAPEIIDYLSVDTEGSELEILSAFDFEQYHVRIITVEHNDTPARAKLYELLSEKGFVRVFEELSGCDDWYVNLQNDGTISYGSQN